MEIKKHYSVVVIGSGFGGCMTALPLAREFAIHDHGESILMLERGTWWTTSVGTVQDKEVATHDLLKARGQPVQFWTTPNHFRGFIDIFTRCFRRKRNEDGLYDFARLGRRGFLGLFGRENDGVSIIRASGVGGGSLVYSNITIRPPNLVFDDARWPLTWSDKERDDYFDLARDAIGRGVLWALEHRDKIGGKPASGIPSGAVNTGLSNIVTRSANLDPHWVVDEDPLNPSRGRKRINLKRSDPEPDAKNDLWIDRARVFQTAMHRLQADGVDVQYGTVDLSINDFDAAAPINQFDDKGHAKNYCERQGRCNIGCLPGARHTLNKQLMVAAVGKPDGTKPIFEHFDIQALADVDLIRENPEGEGGYTVEYRLRDSGKPQRTQSRSVTADKVIVAAGSLGTSELMLKCKEAGKRGLAGLSERVGFGFSTNGDYIAFLDKTKERTRLTRGPVTTSFAHFNETSGNQFKFHTLEDQGIPPAMASLVGAGMTLMREFSKGNRPFRFVGTALLFWLLRRLITTIKAIFTNFRKRQEFFWSDDEILAKQMCVVAMGQDAAVGHFRLGKRRGETSLRVKRTDGRGFHEDPIYRAIEASLDKLALVMAEKPGNKFENPFLSKLTGELKAKSIALSHPLGGCRMAKDLNEGVVDEFGRVFDARMPGRFYEGLYIVDGAMIPTALGVNPSLTITALSLRIADRIIEDLRKAEARIETGSQQRLAVS